MKNVRQIRKALAGEPRKNQKPLLQGAKADVLRPPQSRLSHWSAISSCLQSHARKQVVPLPIF